MKVGISITVEGKKHPVKYGYKAYKLLAYQWGVNKISGLADHFAKAGFKVGVEPTFEQYDVLGEIVLAGVLHANSEADLSPEDCVDFLFHNSEYTAEIIKAFTDSFPKQETVKKPGKSQGVKK